MSADATLERLRAETRATAERLQLVAGFLHEAVGEEAVTGERLRALLECVAPMVARASVDLAMLRSCCSGEATA